MKPEHIMYTPSLLELALNAENMEIPQRGFHTLYEREVYVDSVGNTVVAYIVGGANDGVRYTIVIGPCGYGWSQDFRFPVMERYPEGLEDAVRNITPQELLITEELPGFIAADDVVVHEDGWYSRGLFAYELPSELTLPDAKLYRIREGVYMSFSDGSYRLAAPREFYSWPYRDEVPVARQGDLLAFNGFYSGTFPGRTLATTFPAGLRRHEISVEGDFQWAWANDYDLSIMPTAPSSPVLITLTHPEHETVTMEEAAVTLSFLPGQSRPFGNDPESED